MPILFLPQTGAFLVPYLLFLVVGGIPLVFLEMSLGQYASLGPITIWRCAPLFKGKQMIK